MQWSKIEIFTLCDQIIFSKFNFTSISTQSVEQYTFIIVIFNYIIVYHIFCFYRINTQVWRLLWVHIFLILDNNYLFILY